MKALILTNENYKDFIQDNTKDFDDIEIYWGEWDFFKWIFGNPPEYDIGISFMYQYKVPKEQLDKPWFNFHPAPLPEYKGRNLCYNAIINNEKDFGATIHYMDEDFDTGDIIEVSKFPIQSWDTAQSLSARAIVYSKELFCNYLSRIILGENFPRIKNMGGYYYYKKPIDDFVDISDDTKSRIRAITYKEFYPKVNIGGHIYKIVRDK